MRIKRNIWSHLIHYFVLFNTIILFQKGFPVQAYLIYAGVFIIALVDLIIHRKNRVIIWHWSIITILSIFILVFFDKS